MKATIDRKSFLSAFAVVSAVAPARSPKPILQNVKLDVGEGGEAVLSATDLEVGVKRTVLGVEAETPGSVILPTVKFGSILKTSGDQGLSIETTDDHLVIRGSRSNFKLPLEDPALFPEVPGFTADAYHALSASDLRRLIRRTAFACDPGSARYALGGCLVELEPTSVTLVGTDGRRLAKASADAAFTGEAGAGGATPVLPLKALKLIERGLDDDGSVQFAIVNGSAMVQAGGLTIYTRLLEGRFPRYADVFPDSPGVKFCMGVGPLLAAVEQASIVTAEESRGVDFTFRAGSLELAAQTSDVGSSRVEMPLDYDGPDAVVITFDPHYLMDALRALDEGTEIVAELIDGKNAAVFRAGDSFSYVLMPLTRDR